MNKLTRHFLVFLKILFIVLILSFFYKYAHQNWQTLLDIGFPNWSLVFIGSFFALTSILISPLIYKSLVSAYGYRLSYTTILAVQSISRLGKYIPGKIWIALMSVWFYHKKGVPKKVAATSILLISIVSILGAVLIISTSSLWFQTPKISTNLIILAFILFVLIHPRIFYPLVNFGLNIINHENITPPNVSYIFILKLIISYSVIWILYGIGFYFIVLSYTEIPGNQVILIISLFALAQIMGFIVVFLPAGLGVREGVLLLGLIPIVGESQALVLIIVSRLWQTALEFIMTAVGAFVFWYKKIPIIRHPEIEPSTTNTDK